MLNRNDKTRTTEYARTFLADVIKWLFILLMLVQMVLGLLWIIGNIGKEANFHDTLRYLQAVGSGKIDEYMGPVYPIIIWLAKEIQNVIRLPYHTSIYLWQLLLAAVVMYKVFVRIVDPKKAILFAGYVLSFPMLIQMHLAVLPYSFATSILVYTVCECWDFVKKPRKDACVKIGVLWVLAGLLLPEYFVFTGILVVPCFVWVLIRHKEYRMPLIMAMLLAAICTSTVSAATQTPGSLDRAQKTSGVAALHRFVWPEFMGNSYFWDARVEEVLSEADLLRVSQYPEVIDYEFVPALQEAYGVSEANKICWQMAIANIGVSTKQVVKTIGKDFVWNANPILGFQFSLSNNDRTLVGWNYARLQDFVPLLTKYYINAAMTGWNVMCLLGIVMCLLSGKKYNIGKCKTACGIKWLIAVGSMSMIAYYTLVCSMQDYKQMMPVILLWLLPVVMGYKIIKELGEQNG